MQAPVLPKQPAGNRKHLPAGQDVFFRGADRVGAIPKAAETFATRYKDFLGDAVCAPLTAKRIVKEAEKHGFKPFPQSGALVPGDRYYINNDYGAVALVVIGKRDPVTSGFNMVGAHMDSPQLMLKPAPLYGHDLEKDHGVAKFKVRTSGGLIMETWRDRPLGIAGRVMVVAKDDQGRPIRDPGTGRVKLESKWIQTDGHSVIIPRVPIHFNREANKDRPPIEPENELSPVAGTLGDGAELSLKENVDGILEGAYGFGLEDVVDGDLYFYPAIPAQDTGLDKSLIAGQGHDDRSMCFAAMEALFESTKSGTPEFTNIAMFFDHEETGSLNRHGAQSSFPLAVVGNILEKSAPHGKNTKSLALAREEALANSTLISADVAHAWEPDQAKYHDERNAAYINEGPAIKSDSGDNNYATRGRGIALIRDLAERGDVPVQVYNNNQNISCGTTIGPMLAAKFNTNTIDIGTPIWSMHSSMEVVSKLDLYNTRRLFEAFYNNA